MSAVCGAVDPRAPAVVPRVEVSGPEQTRVLAALGLGDLVDDDLRRRVTKTPFT